MGIKSSSKKRVIRLVSKRFREGNVERNSNMITSSLGTTINGAEPVNGMAPNDFKKTVDMAGDLMKQQAGGVIASTETATQQGTPPTAQGKPIVDPQSDLGKALTGQQSTLDLSKVPDDQKNMLLQTMIATGSQKK